MADIYSQMYVHLVFSVKGRQSLIEDAWKDRMYKNICWIAIGKAQKVYAIEFNNGNAAHFLQLLTV